MDQYIVSARKYRPQTFSSVVGQEALTTTLKNAIATGKLAHAYLFCGPRGVGKTTCARIFAKAINCEHLGADGEPCGECESCRSFNEQRNLNIHELDAASNNSVEDIRSLIEQAQIPPQVGRYKVFIIDEVHMLSSGAFNAFLKTLEEPPAHVVFILATTEKNKLLPTILSRCQIYDFKRMEVDDIVNHLKFVAADAGISYEEDALNVIAQKADGGMRDALSIFDQVASFSNGDITYHKVIEDLNVLDYEYYFALTDQLLQCRIPQVLLTLNELLEKGFEGQNIMGGLAIHFRNLLVSRDKQTLPLLNVAESIRQRYGEQAARCQPARLYKALRLCNNCDVNYRTSGNKRLLIELTLIEIAQLASDDEPGSGHGPTTTLKPIFTTLPPQAAAAPTTQQPQSTTAPASTTPAAAGQQTAAVGQQTAAVRTATTNATPTGTTPTRPTRQRPATISIRGTQPAAETPAKVNEPVSAKDDSIGEKDFNLADVRTEWLRYASTLPQEQRAMASRMKAIEPTILNDGTTIEVVAENEMVIEQFSKMESQMTAFLRKTLNNRNVKMAFRQREIKEEHRAYSQKEKLAVMLNKNKALVLLAKELKLELS